MTGALKILITIANKADYITNNKLENIISSYSKNIGALKVNKAWSIEESIHKLSVKNIDLCILLQNNLCDNMPILNFLEENYYQGTILIITKQKESNIEELYHATHKYSNIELDIITFNDLNYSIFRTLINKTKLQITNNYLQNDYKNEQQIILDMVSSAVGIFSQEGKLIDFNEKFFEFIITAFNIDANTQDTSSKPHNNKQVVIHLEKIQELLAEEQSIFCCANGKTFLLTQQKLQNDKTLIVSENITGEHKITQELTKIKLQNKKLENAKSVFISNITHDLKTPLNSVIGFSELLLQDTKNNITTSINSEQEKYIKIINDSGLELLNYINTILEITKIENGDYPLNTEEINIYHLCEEITNNIGLHFDMEVTIDIPKRITIHADYSLIFQVIVILVKRMVYLSSIQPSIKFTAGDNGKEKTIALTFMSNNSENGLKLILSEISNELRDDHILNETYLANRFIKLHGGNIEVEFNSGREPKLIIIIPESKNAELETKQLQISNTL